MFVETWTLTVDEGQRVNLTFLDFHIEDDEDNLCAYDWIDLASDNYNSRHCGQTSEPWTIISNGNTLTITFRSDGIETRTGFLAVWTATTEPPTYPTTSSTGCEDCTFPFVSNDRVFDTCTSIDGDQPWCQMNPPGPIDQGIHLIKVKSYCSDSDSSCPSTPQMSTHVNNQPGHCCKFYKLCFNLCLRIIFRLWNTKQRR